MLLLGLKRRDGDERVRLSSSRDAMAMAIGGRGDAKFLGCWICPQISVREIPRSASRPRSMVEYYKRRPREEGALG